MTRLLRMRWVRNRVFIAQPSLGLSINGTTSNTISCFFLKRVPVLPIDWLTGLQKYMISSLYCTLYGFWPSLSPSCSGEEDCVPHFLSIRDASTSANWHCSKSVVKNTHPVGLQEEIFHDPDLRRKGCGVVSSCGKTATDASAWGMQRCAWLCDGMRRQWHHRRVSCWIVTSWLATSQTHSICVGHLGSVVACATYKREIAGSIPGCAECALTLCS